MYVIKTEHIGCRPNTSVSHSRTSLITSLKIFNSFVNLAIYLYSLQRFLIYPRTSLMNPADEGGPTSPNSPEYNQNINLNIEDITHI